MSMQELTDDQLDGLFRKSAEEFNPPHDPAAWQAMTNLLDQGNQVVPEKAPLWKKITSRGLSVLFLLLLSVGGWVAYRQQKVIQHSLLGVAVPPARIPRSSRLVLSKSDELNPATIHENHLSKPRPTPEVDLVEEIDADGFSEKPHTKLPIATKTKTEKPDEKLVDEGTGTGRKIGVDHRLNRSGLVVKSLTATTRSVNPIDHTAATSFPKISRESLKNTIVPNGSIHQKHDRLTRTRYRSAASFSKYTVNQSPAFTNRGIANQLADNTVQPTENASDVTIEPASMPILAELGIRSGRWPKPLAFMSRELVLPDTAESDYVQKPALQSQPKQTGLSVRLVVAPDLSAIGLKDFQRPGTNLGLMLEYRLTSRWSVQVGAIQSTKVYKAATTDYELQPYMLKWMVQPESVSGRCNLIDIPINVRYDVALRPGKNGQLTNRWFVTGGVTTYIMRQEDYIYNYADPGNPHIYSTMREWHGSTGRYNFSQLNMSGGYERAISRRLSWQVEPFIKVPLRGVGFFKIDLLSTGAFVSLRYKL